MKDWITALPAQTLPTATPAASTASSQAPTATSRASTANLQASLPESRPSTRGHLRPNQNPKTPARRKSPEEDKEFDDATDEEDHDDVGREDDSLFQDDPDRRVEDLPEEPTDTFTEGPGSIDEPPDFEDPKQVEAWASQYDGCSPADLMVRYGLGLFITMIVTFTNLHLDYTQSGIARVTEHELYVYFAIMLIMSVLKAPNAKLYWKAQRRGILPEGPAFQFPDLTSYLPYQRFTQIRSIMKFSDYSKPSKTDSLWKVRPVIELVRRILMNGMSRLYRNQSVDERRVPFKGRAPQIRRNPSKPIKIGFTMTGAVDIFTHYFWSFHLEDGSVTAANCASLPYKMRGKQIVQHVQDALSMSKFNTGICLFVDRLYNSVALTKKVTELGCFITGTIDKDRGVPSSV